MDTYYLNDAVHLLDAYLATTENPAWGGSIVYGPREPHCWAGPASLVERLRMMADQAAASAARSGTRAPMKTVR